MPNKFKTLAILIFSSLVLTLTACGGTSDTTQTAGTVENHAPNTGNDSAPNPSVPDGDSSNTQDITGTAQEQEDTWTTVEIFPANATVRIPSTWVHEPWYNGGVYAEFGEHFERVTVRMSIREMFEGNTGTLDGITEERNSFTFDDGNVGSVHTIRQGLQADWGTALSALYPTDHHTKTWVNGNLRISLLFQGSPSNVGNFLATNESIINEVAANIARSLTVFSPLEAIESGNWRIYDTIAVPETWFSNIHQDGTGMVSGRGVRNEIQINLNRIDGERYRSIAGNLERVPFQFLDGNIGSAYEHFNSNQVFWMNGNMSMRVDIVDFYENAEIVLAIALTLTDPLWDSSVDDGRYDN